MAVETSALAAEKKRWEEEAKATRWLFFPLPEPQPFIRFLFSAIRFDVALGKVLRFKCVSKGCFSWVPCVSTFFCKAGTKRKGRSIKLVTLFPTPPPPEFRTEHWSLLWKECKS